MLLSNVDHNSRISNASMKCNLKSHLSSSTRAQTQSTGKLIPNSVASTHQRRCLPSVTIERRTHSIAAQDATADFYRKDVKRHFPGCITKHGNPNALKWNGHVSLQPAEQGGRKDQARRKKFNDTLRAFSGIKIPSKLLPGEEIVRFKSSRERGNSLCAVCGGGPFSTNKNVKSHFMSCVKKYGNPRAADWYDRLDPRRHLSKRPDTIANAPTSV